MEKTIKLKDVDLLDGISVETISSHPINTKFQSSRPFYLSDTVDYINLEENSELTFRKKIGEDKWYVQSLTKNNKP